MSIVQFIGKDYKEFTYHVGSAKLAREILREKAYCTFDIPKKGSKEVRTIEAPHAPLKALQKTALKALETMKINKAAHGFTKGKNNATAAAEAAKKIGISRATVIGYDMRKAFPTIKRSQVRELWKELIPNATKWQLHILARACCRNGVLATGSPASPHILNLVARKLDEKMKTWTDQNNGVYIRYADDCVLIVYSHRKERIKAGKEALKRTIESAGFTAHPQKNYATRINLDSPAAEIIGAKVKAGEVKARKKYRRRIRALNFQLRKRIAKTLKPQQDRGITHLKARLQGQTSYSIYLSSKPENTKNTEQEKNKNFSLDREAFNVYLNNSVGIPIKGEQRMNTHVASGARKVWVQKACVVNQLVRRADAKAKT
jgi:hypothetical protein